MEFKFSPRSILKGEATVCVSALNCLTSSDMLMYHQAYIYVSIYLCHDKVLHLHSKISHMNHCKMIPI